MRIYLGKIKSWFAYQWHVRLWLLSEYEANRILANSFGFEEIAFENPKYSLYRARASYHKACLEYLGDIR